MSAVAQQTRSEGAAQNIGSAEIRAVENYMSALSSAVQLADVQELEKAARLVRRSLTSAKKANAPIDFAAIEARARVLTREGYIAGVDRQVERIEKQAAKGALGECDTLCKTMEEWAEKARELGGIVVIDSQRVEGAMGKARQLAQVNAERDRIINDHLHKVGSAFLAMYEAATGDSPTAAAPAAGTKDDK
jgi:hypothetical protein